MIRPEPLTHTTGLQDMKTTTGLQISRWALPLLLLLALLHGAQYAALMPPWGLVDEAQHFDYVWHIAVRGDLPVAGTTTLSPALIDSLFATRHWFVFHWSTPMSTAIADLGTAGFSYEAYHPPLYYLLLAPAYLGSPGSILDRLFVLRSVTVALSLVTVYLFFRLGALVSGSALFAMLATLVFVMLPERAAYASRVNNDVLAELLGTGICLVTTKGILQSLTRSRAVGLGLLLALGIWTKLSVSFWLGPLVILAFWLYPRADGPRWLLPLLMGSVALGALLARNWVVYHDLTGFGGFHRLYQIAAPPLQLSTLLIGIQDLFSHFWFIWWKGSQAGSTLFTRALYLALAVLTLTSAALLARGLWRRRRALRTNWRSNSRLAVFLFFTLAACIYAVLTLYTYFQGIVPVLQGRFLAPATAVYVLLYASGWWHHRLGARMLFLTALGLFVVGMLVLWGNLLPYHYYWGSVNASMGALRTVGDAAVTLFWSNLASDKPPAIVPALPLVVIAYWFAAAVTFYWTCRWSMAARGDLDRTAGV
jgi:4-amino-4-deoxy-L-arabinose transferase-like glycosyltransferase